MTWAFLYVAALLVGLALAAVTGLLHDVTRLVHTHLVVSPRHNAAGPLPSRVLRCLAVALCTFGFVGLGHSAFRPLDHHAPMISASAASILGVLLALLVFRPRRVVLEPTGSRRSRATVVREIPAGGYGQIRLDRAGVIMAAQAEDGQTIPLGSTVEVLDTDRTVVRVRRVEA